MTKEREKGKKNETYWNGGWWQQPGMKTMTCFPLKNGSNNRNIAISITATTTDTNKDKNDNDFGIWSCDTPFFKMRFPG